MERILLKESKTDNPCNLQSQLLVIRKNITTDQLNDFHQRALLVQNRHQLITVAYKFSGNIISVPWA